MKKKILSILLACSMVLGLTACSGGNATQSDTYTIGICQLVQHEALDAATTGFQDALTEEFGDKVVFDVQNAQGDSNTCSTIVNGFVSSNVDLILANATPALQAAAASTNEIPILGTSVTEYGVALDIKDFNGTVGGNISGTSDLAPLDQQAQMLNELFPDAKKVGLLYCSAEANSLYQVTVVQESLEGMGYECTAYPFSDSNDISTVVTKATNEVDVIYVPTDNTVASNTGVATLSISYYDLGYATGKMAARVLRGEDISTMPIEYAPQFTKKYNPAICTELDITIPEGYEAIQ